MEKHINWREAKNIINEPELHSTALVVIPLLLRSKKDRMFRPDRVYIGRYIGDPLFRFYANDSPQEQKPTMCIPMSELLPQMEMK